ncbi:MAG TPA: hypothetical protein VFO58_10715 [Vicinamibacterales bacterium]|nr:hypothetical protein [Vicinamibacterales bacterium]
MSSLDEQVRSALDRVVESLKGQLESDLTTSAADILRAVAEDRDRADADRRQETDQQLAALRQEFERERAEFQRQTADEIAALKQTIESVRSELGTAALATEEERQQREAVQSRLEDSRREAEDARRELDDIRRVMEAAQQETQKARVDAGDTRRELDSVRTALLRADSLVSGLRALNGAQSLGDVLEALFDLASRESGRAAVFLLRGGGLVAWRARGFDTTVLRVGADLVPGQAGLVAAAAQAGARKDHPEDGGTGLPAFAVGNGPCHAVALPVEVSGSVIAVLYADKPEADNQEHARWPTILDQMARHAGRVLEAVTVRHAAAMWAPRAAANVPSTVQPTPREAV